MKTGFPPESGSKTGRFMSRNASDFTLGPPPTEGKISLSIALNRPNSESPSDQNHASVSTVSYFWCPWDLSVHDSLEFLNSIEDRLHLYSAEFGPLLQKRFARLPYILDPVTIWQVYF
jgi:hypothetical protein